MSFAEPPATIATIIAAHQDRAGALLPILHALQHAFGHVPPEAVPEIASALNLSRAEVHGVITYYHHFRTAPPPRHELHICCAESCQSMGAERLVAHAEKKLARGREGECGLQAVYCLGLCSNSPAVMMDGKLHAAVTPEKLDRILDQAGGWK